MWKKLRHVLVGPIARAILLERFTDDPFLASPHGPPIAHGSGPDPDRILLIGDIVVRGVGVATHDLALSGYLARKLAAITGRGADVDMRGIDRFDTTLAAETLRHEDLLRFDAVVLMIGIRETMSLRAASRWRGDIRKLLRVIAEVAPLSLPVLVVGIAPFASTMAVPPFVVRWLETQLDSENAETERACRETGAAQYVSFTPELTAIRLGRDSAPVYRSWAEALAPVIAHALVPDALIRDMAVEPAIDEKARQHALDELGVVGTAPNGQASRIVEMARDMLGMDSASLNFIDHDRQWSQASSGIDPVNVFRTDAICSATIKSPGVLVVPDVDKAPEFRDADWLQGPDHIRFYAGYPLEAPGGERVGALCVMNRSPRTFSRTDVATLRDLALRAQRELWLAAT